MSREKPKRGHAVVLGGTLFLGRTAALTGSIFELAELHSRIHFRCYGKRMVWFGWPPFGHESIEHEPHTALEQWKASRHRSLWLVVSN